MVGEELLRALELSARALESCGIGYALIGGAAMPAWRHDRSTRDVDWVVLVDSGDERDKIERIVSELRNSGFAHEDRLDRRRVEDGLLLFAWHLLRPRPAAIRIDIFVASSGFRADVIRRARRRRIDGFEVPIASCEDLILLKCLAARPIDLADARALVKNNAGAVDLPYLDAQAEKLGIVDRPWRSAAEWRTGSMPTE